MSYSERGFWLVFCGFIVSVTYGLAYQWFINDFAFGTALLPMFIALSAVHVLGAWYWKELDVGALWTALLIWLYFPMAAAVSYLSAAVGCNEVFITPTNIESPLLAIASALNILAATIITVQFLRARESDPTTRVFPFALRSAAFQVVLGPLLVVGGWVSQ